MIRRILVVGLSICLFASPVLAQSLEESIRAAAVAAVAQQAQMEGPRISPGYLLPAVALLAGGGVYLMTGTFGCGTAGIGRGCNTSKMGRGAGIAAAGAALLFVGKAKARPQLVGTPDGLVLRSHITF